MASNYKSTVTQQGKYVTQIMHFVGDVKRTFENIDTHSIKQGEFTKMKLKDGRMIMVNTKNILCVEIFPEEIV